MATMNNRLLPAVMVAFACALGGALTSATVAAAEPSLLEGKGVADAVAKMTEKMKAPVRVLNIEIRPATVTLQVQDPAAPTHIDEHSYVRAPGRARLARRGGLRPEAGQA